MNNQPSLNPLTALAHIDSNNRQSPTSCPKPNDTAESRETESDDSRSPLAKAAVVATACVAILAVSFASSVFGPAAATVAEQYKASEITVQLGVSLFVAGFAAGPLLWGPIAEVIGITRPLVIGTLGCALFHIPLGLANSLPTVLVSRFLAGAFGSSVLALGSGLVVKQYTGIPRAIALACCATSINVGAVVGPIVANYVLAWKDWQSLAWVVLILFGCIAPTLFFLRPWTTKSNAPSVVHDQGLCIQPLAMGWRVRCLVFLRIHLTKPFVLFIKEPILVILTVHLTFVYGLLYMSFQLFPLAYVERGWPSTSSTLPLLAVAIGLLASLVAVIVFMATWYRRRWEQNACLSIPEHHLPPMISGAIVLPPALLWFGWSMQTSWVSQAIASAFIGFGLQLIFISGISYLVEVYSSHIVSAMSIHVTFRCVFAATFPLWTKVMHKALGIEWTATVLSGFALLLTPFPVLFFTYGKRIRKWSRFTG